MNKKEDLENIIRETKREGSMSTLEEIKLLFDSLKPYICAWSESAPEAEVCFDERSLLKKPLDDLIRVDLIDNLLFLIPRINNEQIDLAMELLKYYNYNLNYRSCDQEQKQMYFYPEDDPGRKGPLLNVGVINNFPNRTVLGSILINVKFEKLRKAKEFIEKLRRGEIPQRETSHQTNENPEVNSEQNTRNNIPGETEVEKKVREAIIKGEEATRSDDLVEVEQILAKLEFIASGSDEKKQAFSNWAGFEVINNLKSRQRVLKDNQTEDNRDQGNRNYSNGGLRQVRERALFYIITALNQDPKITDNELDYHQRWKEELEKFTDPSKIEEFKQTVISHIQRKRQAQKAEKIKNAQGKSGEELRKDLENLKKGEGDKSYQEQQPAIEELSKKSAQEDPASYQKMVVGLIKENLKTNQVEESELEKFSEIKNNWEKMKKGENSQPEEIISAEKKITKKVGELGADKRFKSLVQKVNQALNSNKKEHSKKALEKIAKFVSSSNIYDQAICSQRESKIRELKTKLENYSRGTLQTNSPPKFPWQVAVPIILLALIIIAIIVISKKKKRLRLK